MPMTFINGGSSLGIGSAKVISLVGNQAYLLNLNNVPPPTVKHDLRVSPAREWLRSGVRQKSELQVPVLSIQRKDRVPKQVKAGFKDRVELLRDGHATHLCNFDHQCAIPERGSIAKKIQA